MTLAHVFISYSRADRSYVERLVHYLRRADIEVWFDQQSQVGAEWPAALETAIENAAAILFVISPAARQSKFVHRELDFALSRARHIFGVVLDDGPSLRIDPSRIEYVQGRLPSREFAKGLAIIARGWSNENVSEWSPPPPVESLSRPELHAAIAQHVQTRPATMALWGAAGSGKSALLSGLVHRIRAEFPGGVTWLGLGESHHGARLRSTIARLCRDWGDRPRRGEDSLTALSRNLSERPPTLLVLDDIRSAAQLMPLLRAGVGDASVLITARNPAALPVGAPALRVDALSQAQRRRLLLAGMGLDVLSRAATDRALQVTRGWPLALDMLNRALRREIRDGRDPEELISTVYGLSVHPSPRGPGSANRRYSRLSVIVEAALRPYRNVERRLFDLSVFPQFSRVDRDLVVSLWSTIGGLTANEANALIADLAELGLVWTSRSGGRHIVVSGALADMLHANVESSHAQLLSIMGSRYGIGHDEWWRLPLSDSYERRQLIHHLSAAGRSDIARRLMRDPRWLSPQLQLFGVDAANADLALADPGSTEMSCLLAEAELLSPILPAHSHADLVATHVGGEPAPGDFVRLRRAWGGFRDGTDPLRGVVDGHLGPVNGLACRGRWIATASDDHTARLWDVHAGRSVWLDGHRAPVTAIAWVGSVLVTASQDGTARVWSEVTGDCEQILVGHHGWVRAVAVSPDGTLVATAGNDATVRLWAPDSGSPLETLSGHRHAVRALAFAPGGDRLASGGDDGVVHLWDPQSGASIMQLHGHTDALRAVAWSPDGRWLASAGDDALVRLWDAATGESRALTGHTDRVTALDVAADGSWLASASRDELRVWSADGLLLGTLRGRTGTVRAIAVQPDTRWLVTAGEDGRVRSWDATAFPSPGHDRRRAAALGVVAAAPSGRWLAVGGDDGPVRIVDAVDGHSMSALAGHHLGVSALAIADDQAWLASASDDGTIRVWDLAAGTAKLVLSGHTGWIGGIAAAPDGSWLASAGDDRTLRIWDLERGAEQLVLHGHTDRVNAVTISPDGKWFITTSDDRTVRVWDAITGSARAVLNGHTAWVRGAAISPDGTWFATASGDGTVRLWDAEALAELSVLAGHDGPVSAVAIAPDGQLLASVGADATLRLWDAATGTNVATTRVTGPLLGLDWAPDGGAVFVVGLSGAYRFAVSRARSVRPVSGHPAD